MNEASDTSKIRNGFHLDDGAVIICRQLSDGWWEAWIEEADSPVFTGSTRFKAQCKAVRWYGKTVSLFNFCA